MKKVILIVSMVLSCIGCTHEGPHSGCEGSLNLLFTCDGNVADFDRLVGSDVELYLYDSEGKWIERLHIPYESIGGGRLYPLQWRHTGDMRLLAWTLSGKEDAGKKSPVFIGEENYATARFSMGERAAGQPSGYHGSRQELFLESVPFTWNLLEDRILHVDVKKQLCSVFVTIEEGKSFATQYSGELSVNIYGSSGSYKVAEGKQGGDRVVVGDTFSYVPDRDEYIAENKVMPASTDPATDLEDNIVVTLLEGGIARLSVDTEIKAQRDMQIYVVIRPTKLEAVITVGSWQIRKALATL